MSEVLVSVVVPVYNTERYLEGCLESLSRQTYSNLEIVVVDDGSPDSSVSIAEKFRNSDKRFNIIRQRNLGLSAARNTGIDNISGDYLLFLDSDDCLQENAIELLVENALANDADAVFPDRCINVYENGKSSLSFHFLEGNYFENPVEFATKVLIAQGRAWRATSVLYRTDIVGKGAIRFPVGKVAEDVVFNLHFLSLARRISQSPEPTLLVAKRAKSITTSYNPKILESFLYVDNQVDSFLKESNIRSSEASILRDSLMCRNAVIAITHLTSRKSGRSLGERYNSMRRILDTRRVVQAFEQKDIMIPYFQSRMARKYFSIQYRLLRRKHFSLSFMIGLLAESLKERIRGV